MAGFNLFRLKAGRSVSRGPTRFSTRLQRLHQTPPVQLPRKDSQDQDSINTEATEYSKSGTDDQAARQEQAAFDPSTTDPAKEKSKAGEGNEKTSNPLDVSPANTDISKQRPLQEGRTGNSSSERNQSGHGSPKKEKKV